VLLPDVLGAAIALGTATVTVLPVDGSCVGLTWPDDLAAIRALIGRLVATGQLPDRVEVEAGP
jgi:hypothetical protein